MIKGLADKLEKLRASHNFSCAFVASQIHMATQTISDYETGKCQPSLEAIIKLATFYKVSADYLLGLEKVDSDNYVDVTTLTTSQKAAVRQVATVYAETNHNKIKLT